MDTKDIYTTIDCDGDGVKDHICQNGNDGGLSMVLSSEGCPDSWGEPTRKKSECPGKFGKLLSLLESCFDLILSPSPSIKITFV